MNTLLNYSIVVLKDMDGDIGNIIFVLSRDDIEKLNEINDNWNDYQDDSYEFSFDISKYLVDSKEDTCLYKILYDFCAANQKEVFECVEYYA